MGSRQNQVRSYLGGLVHFSYEHAKSFKGVFLKKLRSHLGEPARLTGPAHFHRNSPLAYSNMELFYHHDSNNLILLRYKEKNKFCVVGGINLLIFRNFYITQNT